MTMFLVTYSLLIDINTSFRLQLFTGIQYVRERTMKDQNKPITSLSWRKMQVNIKGEEYDFKDCKIWPEGASGWDWNLTGTSHETGIQPDDIKDILEHDIEVMVLSRGFDLKMKVSPATETLLRSLGIEYHIHDTQKAAELFNNLTQQGKRAGGIFHSTC